MRIVVNTLEFAPATGIDVHALEMSRALAHRGHEIHAIAQRDGELRADWDSFTASTLVAGPFLHQPLSPQQLGDPGKLAHFAGAWRKATQRARQVRPDVIYANDSQALMWASASAGGTRAGLVCHLHNDALTPVGRQRQALARRVDRFIAPSSFTARAWVRQGLPESKLTTIHQAVDPRRFPVATPRDRAAIRAQLQIPGTAFVVVFLGRIVADKGVDVLVDAWRQLGLGPEEGRLVVVGRAFPPSYLEALASKASDSVIFVRPQSDVVPMLHAADLVAIPSVSEDACPRVLIEAMATGVPIAASRTGGIPEILEGDLDRFLVTRGDPVELAEMIGSLRGWQRREPDLGAEFRGRVVQSFSLEAAVNAVEAELERAALLRA